MNYIKLAQRVDFVLVFVFGFLAVVQLIQQSYLLFTLFFLSAVISAFAAMFSPSRWMAKWLILR